MRFCPIAFILIIVCAVSGFGQTATSLVLNGDALNRIDLLILGDGYTEDEFVKFATDATGLQQHIFSEEPFREYELYFNVWRVDVASPESGSDHPERDPPVARETAFDSTYNCADIERLICINHSKVQAALSNVPLVQRDYVFMIVNDDQYGGSGGTVAVTSRHKSGRNVLLHELGHSMASLADEYTSSPPECVNDVEPFQVNVTMETDPASIKWRIWIDAGTEIPTESSENGVPGLYQGARYCTEGLYRPTFNSRMRSSPRPYEQINEEQFIRSFYGIVSPIDAVEPLSKELSVTEGDAITFSVSTKQPATHDLDVTWTVDGVASGEGSTFVFDSLGLIGDHTIAVMVSDATSAVRNDPNMLLRDQRDWDITVQPSRRRRFRLTSRGGTRFTSPGGSAQTVVGYAGITPDPGSVTPSGIAILGYRKDGVLVSEAGVTAAVPIQQGRIFAEVSDLVNTGLAIANPNEQAVTVNFFFTDSGGTNFGSGSFTLGANEQVAKFLSQEPFNGGHSILGTFTLMASRPISVIALRIFTNEQAEFLMTTLPVAPLTPPAKDTIYFPHFADGSGWTTQVILVNPSDSAISGTVQFLGEGNGMTEAPPLSLMLNDGSTGSTFSYSIPPRSVRRLTTANPSGALSVGSLRAKAAGGSTLPSGLVIFSYVSRGVTVSEAGVAALPKGSAFRVYVEASGAPGKAGSVRSGIAITNTSRASNTVRLELTHMNGSRAAASQTLSIPPSGQVARVIDELLSVPDNFSGVLRVTSSADVAVVGLRVRINQRGEIKMTTTPPSNEEQVTSETTYFPHIVDSNGWSTQFILFTGKAGVASSGTLSFKDQAGRTLDWYVR